MIKDLKAGEVLQDIVGNVYGSLTVLSDYQRRYYQHGTKIYFKCRCSCGFEKYYERCSILRRKVTYCEHCRPRGVRHSRLYHIYYGMLQRCNNPNMNSYRIYGGKGVCVCTEWLSSYDAFRDWAVSSGYHDGLSIDRIDSNGNYCPENCRWITLSENSGRANIGRQKNKTSLKEVYAILPNGEKEEITNIKKFAEKYGLSKPSVYAALHGRISPTYHGYIFHSDKTRQEGVTTIETARQKKSLSRNGVE